MTAINDEFIVEWNQRLVNLSGDELPFDRALLAYLGEDENAPLSDKARELAAQWEDEVKENGELPKRYFMRLPENVNKKYNIEELEPGEWFLCDVGPGPFLKIQLVKNAVKVYDANTRSFITLGKQLRVRLVDMDLQVKK